MLEEATATQEPIIPENVVEAPKKEATISLTAVVTSRVEFNELLKECKGTPEGQLGKSVKLSATDSTGRPCIYVNGGKSNCGMCSVESEEDKKAFGLIKSGYYNAYIISPETTNTLNIRVKVVESLKPQGAEAVEKSAKTLEEEIISSGKLTKAELDARIEHLAAFQIKKGDKLFNLTLAAVKRQPEGRNIPLPANLYEATGKDVREAYKETLRCVVLGYPILLEGPQSAGKNTMVEDISWVLNRKIFTLQGEKGLSVAKAYGYESTDNSCKNALSREGIAALISSLPAMLTGGAVSDEALDVLLNVTKSMSPTLAMTNGPVLQALEWSSQGYGSTLVLDEMNMNNPNTLSGIMNSIMDNHTPYIYVAGKGEVPIVRENLSIFGTQNGARGGEYAGTQTQNAATMSRMLNMKVPTPSSIIPILRKENRSVEESVLTNLNKIFQEYAKGVDLHTLPKESLNLRGFKMALGLIESGSTIEEAMKRVNGQTSAPEKLDDVVDNLLVTPTATP